MAAAGGTDGRAQRGMSAGGTGIRPSDLWSPNESVEVMHGGWVNGGV